MNYTTSDFTDIRGPEEKPTVPGWYSSSPNVFMAAIEHKHGPEIFKYWNGKTWHSSKTGEVLYFQSRYWFGLKEKP